MTRASGRLKGLNRTASATLKTAVLAPIPSASATTPASTRPGDFSAVRTANRRSESGFMASEDVRHDARQTETRYSDPFGLSGAIGMFVFGMDCSLWRRLAIALFPCGQPTNDRPSTGRMLRL